LRKLRRPALTNWAMPVAAEMAVAGGLALFGAFCLIESWYRILPGPDMPETLKRKLHH
jgi:hypothetical protein